MNPVRGLSLLTTLIAGASLCAQESVGTIRGQVLDQSGKAVAAAVITVSSPNIMGGNRTTTTDANGEYRLPLLLPGSYVIKVSKSEFVGSQASVVLGASQTLRQDLRLKPIVTTVSEVIEVIGTAAAVDKTDTKTATSMTAADLSKLPVGGDLNFFGVLQLAPGVTGDTQYASIRGGIAGQALYTMNGIVVRDPATGQGQASAWMLDDLVEDVAIIQSPVNAKYGNTSSGISNVVTKTGTNEWQGTVRVRLNRNPWGAYDSGSYNRFGQPLHGSSTDSPLYMTPPEVRSDDLSKVYEVSVLGPIIKDRLTFTYGKRFEPSNLSIASATNLLGSIPTNYRTYLPFPGFTGNALAAYTWGVDPNVPTVGQRKGLQPKTDFDQYKLFWQVSTGHQLEVGFSRNTYTSNSWSNAVSSSSPGVDINIDPTQTATRDMFQMNYRGILSDSMVLDINYGKRKGSINFPTGPKDPLYVRAWTNLATDWKTTSSSRTGLYQAEGADSSSQAEIRTAETIKANLQAFWGNHQLDMGVEVLNEIQIQDSSVGVRGVAWYTPGRVANGNFMVFNYVGSWAQTDAGSTASSHRNGAAYIPEMRVWSTEGSSDFSSTVRSEAIYLNDLWKLNEGLSVNLGLRMDRWKMNDRAGNGRVNSQALSPRFMVVWDINQDGTQLLSLSSATMRGTLNQSMMGSFIYSGGNVQRRYFWNQGSTTPYAVAPEAFYNPANYGFYHQYTSAGSDRTLDPNLKPEKTQEFELRYRRALEGGAWVRVSAVTRKVDDMFVGMGYDQAVILQDPKGNPATGASKAFLRSAVQDDIAVRDYKSLELEWFTPVARGNGWQLNWNGSWTLAKLTGRTTYSDTATIQYYGVMATAGVPVDFFNPYGELEDSRRHDVSTWWTFNHGSRRGIQNSFTLLGKYTTGTPGGNLTRSYTYPTGTWTSGVTNNPSTFTGHLNGRGRRKGMDYVACDFTWNLDVPIRGKLKFFSSLSVSQVFNQQIAAVQDISTSSPATAPIWNPATSPNDTVMVNPNGMHTWGAISDWGGVRTVSSFHVGLKF